MTMMVIKLLLYSCVGWTVYKLLLEKRPLFYYNRIFLLSALLLPLLLPWLQIPSTWFSNGWVAQNHLPNNELDQWWVAATVIPDGAGEPLPLPNTLNAQNFSWVAFCYVLVSVIFTVRLLWGLRAAWLMGKGSKEVKADDISFYVNQKASAPYTFAGRVFLPASLLQNKALFAAVWAHERTHARQLHSVDVVVAEMVKAWCWFNPFAWLLARAIRLNHEYLADEKALQVLPSASHYLEALGAGFQLQQHVSITHSFSVEELSKRIKMLGKTTSPKLRLALVTATSFLLLVLALPFANFSEVVAQTPPPKPKKETNPAVVTTPAPALKSSKEDQWKRLSYKYAETPASDEVLAEYLRLCDVDTSQPKWWLNKTESIPEANRLRMKELFVQMTPEQQVAMPMKFMKRGGPIASNRPTAEQFEKFKNAKVYGVWIDDKKVPNSALDNYSADDFAQFYISKLYGAAKKGRSYTHQLDMMTNAHYAKYLKEEKAKANEPLLVIAWIWKSAKKQD